MILATSRLKSATLFSNNSTFSQMTPSTLSTPISLSLVGAFPMDRSSLIAIRRERQLLTIQFYSRYSSNFSPLRKMFLMVFLIISSTKCCSCLTSSTSKGLSNFCEMSHSMSGWSYSAWMSLKTSCLASRKTEILPILESMISALGPDRRDYRFTSRSSTAEWQPCSCWVIPELRVLLSCCSTNSSTKLIFQIICLNSAVIILSGWGFRSCQIMKLTPSLIFLNICLRFGCQ